MNGPVFIDNILHYRPVIVKVFISQFVNQDHKIHHSSRVMHSEDSSLIASLHHHNIVKKTDYIIIPAYSQALP